MENVNCTRNNIWRGGGGGERKEEEIEGSLVLNYIKIALVGGGEVRRVTQHNTRYITQIGHSSQLSRGSRLFVRANIVETVGVDRSNFEIVRKEEEKRDVYIPY